MHDPRYGPSHAAAYVMDAEPGRHTTTGFGPIETGLPMEGVEVPPFDDRYIYTGKGETEAWYRHLQHIMNCSGMCCFGYWMMPRDAVPTLLSCVTGWQDSPEKLAFIGERIAAIREAFTLREGLKPPIDFQLEGRPKGEPPLKEGPVANVTVDVKALCDDYYKTVGWDTETGRPSKGKLLELGLEDIATETADA